MSGHADAEKKSADDHQEDNEHKDSAGAIVGAILIAQLSIPLSLSLIRA